MGGVFANRRPLPRPKHQSPFAIADTEVQPGTLEDIDIPIARLPSGTWISMSVVVIHGAMPGPTMWMSAAIHGDELNGVEIIRRVVSTLDPTKLCGTVLAVPIVNVFAVSAGSRYLPDRRDLNRSFPGAERGSLASRLARIFFDNVAARCELGIDFHSGSGGRSNLAQIRCNLDDPKTRRYATHFAAPVTLHAKLRDGSLRAAADKHGIRILLFEGGEADRFNKACIETGVAGTLRLMRKLEMIDTEVPAAKGGATTFSRSSRWIRTPRSGFCRLAVELGEQVHKGQVLANISDGMDRTATTVKCRRAGIVIATLETALVHQGDALVHLADEA